MPRDPKPGGQRRRRNLDAPRVTRIDAVVERVAVPDVPDGVGEFAASAWRSWWASPMAAVWVAADLPAMVRLVRLTDASARGETSAAVLSEIRQLEDRFGLSPLARRRLAWEIEQAKPSDDAVVEPQDDARWLRAVSD